MNFFFKNFDAHFVFNGAAPSMPGAQPVAGRKPICGL